MKQKRLFSFIPLSLQNNILSHFILLPFALKTHLSLTLGMSLLSCHCSYSSYVAFFFFFYIHPSQNGQWQSLLAYFGLPSAHSCSRHSECLLSECEERGGRSIHFRLLHTQCDRFYMSTCLGTRCPQYLEKLSALMVAGTNSL